MIKNIVIAAFAGAAAGGLVWFVAKGELERDFGAGAEDLTARLRSSGAVLQKETKTLCRSVAEKAIDAKLRSLGFTPSLMRDTARTLDSLNALVSAAERLGLSPQALLRRIS